MRSLLACLAFVVASCGARTSTPPPNAPPPVAARPSPASPTGPSEAECDALYAHAFALSIADRQPPPPEADLATIRGELRAGFIADCRAGTHTYHRCGLAAKSRADLDACR